MDANDRVWITSTTGKTISLFDRDGKPLSPSEGYNFNGQLGIMQSIIVTPSGDVWALDFGEDQVVYLPKGDPSKGKIFCQAPAGTPNKDGPCRLNGAFHLAIDQQDRIWITNALGDTVTRFPASDPSKIEVFPTGGHSGKGMAIDSQGNAWITNTMGEGFDLKIKLELLLMKLTGRWLRSIAWRTIICTAIAGSGASLCCAPTVVPRRARPSTEAAAPGARGVWSSTATIKYGVPTSGAMGRSPICVGCEPRPVRRG